jgi:transposase
VPNKPAALRAFAKSLDAFCLLICEATGGYEAALLAALVTAGIAAHRADARKVKAFIRSFGTLGKSDTIDAKGLSRYGAERHAQLARWQPRDEDRLNLQSLVLTRHDLVKSHTAYQNRLAAPHSAAVRRHLRRVIATLASEIGKDRGRDPQASRQLVISRAGDQGAREHRRHWRGNSAGIVGSAARARHP